MCVSVTAHVRAGTRQLVCVCVGILPCGVSVVVRVCGHITRVFVRACVCVWLERAIASRFTFVSACEYFSERSPRYCVCVWVCVRVRVYECTRAFCPAERPIVVAVAAVIFSIARASRRTSCRVASCVFVWVWCSCARVCWDVHFCTPPAFVPTTVSFDVRARVCGVRLVIAETFTPVARKAFVFCVSPVGRSPALPQKRRRYRWPRPTTVYTLRTKHVRVFFSSCDDKIDEQ